MIGSTFGLIERRAVGSAIQIGVMALAGYFDSEICAGVRIAAWYHPPDWAVTRIHESNGDTFVEGYNLNCAPGEYGHRFNWRFAPGKAFSSWRYRFELYQGSEGHA